MKWFNKSGTQQRGAYRWTPLWEYRVEGVFWQLKISEDGRILCEVRDPEKKTAWFSAISETSGEPLWERLAFDEPWWIGIEDIAEGRAYFHRFKKPDMPQHLGVIAVDMQDGRILWENREVTFLLVDGTDVYTSAQGFESRRSFLLDSATGAVLKELGTNNKAVDRLRADQNEEYLFRNYAYPSHFDAAHPAYSAHSAIVHALVPGEKLRGNLDVLEHSGCLLLSWHETTSKHSMASPELDQKFAAVEIASNSVLYADTINAGVKADAVDSFFVKDGHVLYVKERNVLTALALPTE